MVGIIKRKKNILNWQLLNIVIGLIGFILFAIIQALIINGYKESIAEKMAGEKFGKWLKKLLGEYWFNAFGGCIRCSASGIGAITFWPFVLIFFGWYWQEILLFGADVFVLVYLNFYFYKK